MKYLVLAVLLFTIPVFGQGKQSPAKSTETVQTVSPQPQSANPDKPDQTWKEEYQQAIQLADKIDAEKKKAGIDHLEQLLVELELDLQKRMGPDKKYDPDKDEFVSTKAVQGKP